MRIPRCGEFGFESSNDGRSAASLNDFVKLGAIVGDEANAFYQDIVNAPADREFYQAINHGDRIAACGGGDATRNFAAIWR